jgi:lysophospholipase L1-like esterase
MDIMIDCMILGDSIAHGISNLRKDCFSLAEIGINSAEYNRKYGQSLMISETHTNITIISLGSNDSNNMLTEKELRRLRSSIKSSDVVWIVPGERKQEQRNAVVNVASSYNDRMIEIPYYGPDGIHPTVRGYDELVKRTR